MKTRASRLSSRKPSKLARQFVRSLIVWSVLVSFMVAMADLPIDTFFGTSIGLLAAIPSLVIGGFWGNASYCQALLDRENAFHELQHVIASDIHGD